MRNSKIVLCKNIRLDKEYRNVLSYSEADMVTLCYTNEINHDDHYNFIKPSTNIIEVGFTYEECLQANYIAFQNYDYANKWFFAFIDDVEYRSNGNTRLTFTVDVFATWFSYWQPQACYVLREHVNDDTLGLHTVPENLETGDYICNEHYKDSTMDSYVQDLCYIMASSSEPIAGEAKNTVAYSQIYNGIYTGLTYYRYDSSNPVDIILEIFATYGKTDAINGIFMAPTWLAPLKEGGLYREVNPSDDPLTFNINVSKPTTLDTYSPINNKVKCFPYSYLLVSNNVGQNAILHYEKFSGLDAGFVVRGVLNPGCSINLTPLNYNGSTYSDIDSIQLGKFPICNFQNDMYTNWLTQNSINILGQTVTSDDINIVGAGLSSAVSTITNMATGNIAGAGLSVAGGFNGVANSLMQKKQHNMISPTVVGQLNSADVNVASGNNTFHFYKMSIRKEFAKIVDDFFSRYGYQVNVVKVPNITGRQNFNYVQIGATDNIGYPVDGINANDMREINDIFHRGVTIWHNHSNIGNFSVSNSIVPTPTPTPTPTSTPTPTLTPTP